MVSKDNTVLTVTINKETLTDMDNYCKKMGIKRSALVNIACSQYMQANKVIDVIYEQVKGANKEVGKQK